MEHVKGFSLIEVLISLVLTTTVAFLLLDFQSNSFTFLKQYSSKNQALTLMDSIDEDLLLGIKEGFKGRDPYTLHVDQKSEEIILHITGVTLKDPLTRIHFLAKA